MDVSTLSTTDIAEPCSGNAQAEEDKKRYTCWSAWSFTSKHTVYIVCMIKYLVL